MAADCSADVRVLPAPKLSNKLDGTAPPSWATIISVSGVTLAVALVVEPLVVPASATEWSVTSTPPAVRSRAT